MTIKKELEKLGFFSFKHADEKFNELKEDFMEMSQLKSDFDIEKFTVKKEGNFIAHNFHFLMRQYSLALSELRRMLIEKEDAERKIIEAKTDSLIKEKILIYEGNGQKEKYIDLYIKELINQIDMLDLQIVNKAKMCIGFEACRQKLIELNGGKSPTNEQYQAEEPTYWRWFLQNMALHQRKQATTGISEGVWMNIDYLEEPTLLNPAYQVKMMNPQDGSINLDLAHKEVESRKELDYDFDKIMNFSQKAKDVLKDPNKKAEFMAKLEQLKKEVG